MLVRSAIEHDLPGIAEIVNRAILETTAHFATEPDTIEEVREHWLASRDRFPWLVAVGSQAPAGPAGVLGFARASPWKSRCAYEWTAEITVYVRPEHHRRGIGRSLYARLIETLTRQGYRTLLAGIALPNDPSVALHEAMGMRHVGTLPRVGYKFGRWLDVGYWQLDLPAAQRQPTTIRAIDQI